jgi:recombination protein RecR
MLPEHLNRLIMLFARFPGVGEKTAQRFVLHLLSNDNNLAADLGRELSELHQHLRSCERCGFIAETQESGPSLCRICLDPRRSPNTLCIVAKIQDLLAIERSGAMLGRYFVLGKLLSPLDGIGPSALPLERLEKLVLEQGVTEIILATPPSVEGEATALFISSELAKSGVSISRIASGVPHGGDLEFADQITLGRAILGRRAF